MILLAVVVPSVKFVRMSPLDIGLYNNLCLFVKFAKFVACLVYADSAFARPWPLKYTSFPSQYDMLISHTGARRYPNSASETPASVSL
jgi:hypothetical protein